jgi:hypothetical protein
MTEQISNALNLATIANWVMIMGVAVLVYVSRSTVSHRKPHRSPRKIKILN